MICVFCDKPVDSDDMCCTCGYVDPLRCLEGKFSYSTKKDVVSALKTSLDTQLSSDKHTTALSKQLPELREAFAECAALRRVAAEEGEAFQQDINDISASTRFKKTLLDAYKNNNYIINLDDHQKETDMRVRAGVWEVIRCPSHDDCKGRAFKTTGQCSICQVSVCFDCFETKDKDGHHVCDEAKKTSVQTMMTSSVPCPLCFTPIQKKEGCDQIFCVMCHHAFDYVSHTTISRTQLHNPEFHDFLDRQGQGGVQEKGEETAWVEEHLSLKKRDGVISDIIGGLPPGKEDKRVLVRGTTHALVMYRLNNNTQSTALRFGIVSNADDSVTAVISVKQNGWWSRVMGSEKEVVNRFDDWLRNADMYGVLLTLSKRVKASDDVPDIESVLSKIKWMQGEMTDSCFAKEMFTAVQTSGFDRFKWNLLKCHFLKGVVAINATILKCMQQIYAEAQAFTAAPSDADVFITRIERAINTCLDTVDIVMPIAAQGTVEITHPEQFRGITAAGYKNATTQQCFKDILRQIRSKCINRTDCFVCCKDDGKKDCIGCIECGHTACLACLDQWWTSDACKMHVTMPCCKTPAINLLYVCSNKSQIDRDVRKTLQGPIQNAVLEQERTKRFRYEQFVRNKRHADSLVCDIGNNEVQQARLRAKRQEANERVKHLLSGAGLAKQLRVRNSNDGLGALELYCCSLETPFLGVETTDSTLSRLPKALQQAEDNDTPVDVDLITRMRSEYHVLEILQTALVSSITRRLQKAHAHGSIHEVSSLIQTGLTLGHSIDNALDRAGQHGSGPKYRLRDLMSNIRGSELYIKQVFESFSSPQGDSHNSHKRKRLV